MKTKKLLSIFAIMMAFCSTVQAQDKMKAEKTVRDLFKVMDAGQTDKFGDYCSVDFKIMNPFLPSPMPLQAFQGIIQGQKAGFPDLQHEVVSIVSDGKNVITKGIFKGTNSASFMGMPATGNKVNATFLVWDEMDANNKIIMRKVEFDAKGFEAQLMAGKVTAETIKKNVKIAYESLNKRDWAMFKTVCSASDFTEFSAGPMPIKGVDAAIEAYKMFFSLAPDMKIEIKNIVIDGNRAILETSTTGTNTGMVMGMLPPSGKKIMLDDVEIITLDASGKATSHKNTNPNEIFHQIGYGALVNPNTGVVLNIYENFGKGNVAGIQAACAENIVFDVTDNPFIKMPTVYKNNTEMAKFFGDLMASGEVTKFEPVRFLADGDDVVCLIYTAFKSKTNGKNWGSTFAHHFKFSNGKVVAFKEITTTPWEIKDMSSLK